MAALSVLGRERYGLVGAPDKYTLFSMVAICAFMIQGDMHVHCNILSRVSAHGCLEFTSQNSGVGPCMEKSSVCNVYTCMHTRTIGSSEMHYEYRLLRTVFRYTCIITDSGVDYL